jgi:aminopeptidase N
MSKIIPTVAELAAAKTVGKRYNAQPYMIPVLAQEIAYHTRHETAEEWARLQSALDREKLHAAEWARRNEELEAEVKLLRETRDALERERTNVEQHWHGRVVELEAKLAEYRDAATSRICGRCVAAGNDDEGQPRLVIHTTREQLLQFGRNLAFAEVTVKLQTPNEKDKP